MCINLVIFEEGEKCLRREAGEEVDLVNPEECVLEIDIMETGPEHTLVGVVVKNNPDSTIGYTVSVTLGTKVTKKNLKLYWYTF